MGASHRILTDSIRNPRYDPRVRRGVWSVRRFHVGLPIIVYHPDSVGNYLNLQSSVSIDIPALRLIGLVTRDLVEPLLTHSTLADFSEFAPNSVERLMVCSKCQGRRFYCTALLADGAPYRWICARCRHEIRFVKIVHSAGRA